MINKIINKTALRLIIGALLLIGCCMVGGVGAEENVTNATNSSVEDVPYYESEQYQQDLDDWYVYYTTIMGNATGTTSIKDQCVSVLLKSDIDWDNKMSLIKPILGWDYRLSYYMDSEKCIKDYDTGAVTYDLGLGNWWAQRFGNGVQESSLPQTIAEGEALYKIYCENYVNYVQALREAGNP